MAEYNAEQEHLKVQQAYSLEQREAAAKAISAADKSVRSEEKEFVKGIPKGIAIGYGSMIDLILGGVEAKYPGLIDMPSMREYFGKLLGVEQGSSQAKGADFGEVATSFGGPEDLIKAAGAGLLVRKAKKVLTREEEIAKLAEEQAADAHAWMKRGGEPPLMDQYGVPPARVGEANVSAFKASQQPWEAPLNVDADGMVNMGDDTLMTVEEAAKIDRREQSILAYTQTEGNPFEDVGGMPQAPPQMGRVMEEHGTFANRLASVNVKGPDGKVTKKYVWKDNKYDPELADKYLATKVKQKAAKIAKSKNAKVGTPARYFFFDEATEYVYTVGLDKNGTLQVARSSKISPWKKDPKTGELVRDQKGKKLLSDDIDEVISSEDLDGVKVTTYLNNKIAEVTANVGAGDQIPLPMHMPYPSSENVETAISRVSPEVLPKAKVTETLVEQSTIEDLWLTLPPDDRAKFIEKFKVELKQMLAPVEDEAFDPSKWKTPPPEISDKTLKIKKKKAKKP